MATENSTWKPVWMTDAGNRAGTAHHFTASFDEGLKVRAVCGREVLAEDLQKEEPGFARCKRCVKLSA